MRIETSSEYLDPERIKEHKIDIKQDNYNFIDSLKQFLNQK